MRDLRVQEFLRELIVGAAASSVLRDQFWWEFFIAVKAGT